MKVKIECIVEYDDMQLDERIPVGKQFSVTKERANYLVNERGLAKIIEVIPELEKPAEKKTTKKKK